MEYFKRAKNCIRAYTHVYMCVRRAFACLWTTKNSVCFSVTKEEFVLRSKDHVYVIFIFSSSSVTLLLSLEKTKEFGFS